MPALGESHFVQVDDGRRLHFCVAGSGPVTVFFEAGIGRSRNTWAAVAPLVARFARIVTYDRAGHGLSDVDLCDRGLDRLISDHLAVRNAAVDGPCVVVGHSYGGPITRGGAVRDPDDVAGVVLVDEVSELCDELVGLDGGLTDAVYQSRLLLARLRLLPRIAPRLHNRLLRDTGDEALDQQTAQVLAEAITEVRAEDGGVTAAKTLVVEWEQYGESIRDFAETGPWIPEAPLVEISSNRVPEDKLADDYIAQSHIETAERAERGKHVFASTSSHYIQLTEPSLVVDEIRLLVESALVA
ncbi:alpha/beta fold hydrolase [Williamsia sp. CHRR-6]|uniref:alpha/beta fold hydrolase n=1 Tax=Williamsia sp. CHRR-6 TaxID=2835871 RepID=UPI001BD9ED21|nr:alpha/beta hydrolase [Williamsia sp. CHRR-6]MBT0565771.1 alpha/beta hydrolase [Williamsia sp. CHRR-6]